MLSYTAHTIIFFGYMVGIVGVGTIILLILPFTRFVGLLKLLFSFESKESNDQKHIVIDVCGDNFDVENKISSRFPFAVAVGTCLFVSIVVFIDGCVFSTRHVYFTKECSERIPNCYLFQSNVSKIRPVNEFVCETYQPVIPSNMSDSFAVCYGFVLPAQSTMDVLNQIGVCQGLLYFIDYLYPLCYRFGRYKMGRICLILLLVLFVPLEGILLAAEVNVSLMTIIILASAIALFGSILFLQFRLYRQKKANRNPKEVEEGTPLISGK